ncbi:MAG: UDP-N-acetylglucosamine 2-epimerase (hydrolyzing), partial [Bdellovibrionales bacterium]|nr:UDP-N-acetylglucosamine 2-epimerase (hydrolyzing) [Bdellovibrionales bacterium]
LERFGLPERVVINDGFEVNGRVYMEVEGSMPTTMAKSVGFGIVEFASEFQRLKPDLLLVIGDRYEALAAVIAAAYQNITIAHVQGGEVSGSIDESARHAISKFSHYHFPATERAGEYLRRMGEDPERVFVVGCPVGDLILQNDDFLPKNTFNEVSLGNKVDADKPYLFVIYHPVTTEFGNETHQVEELLFALHELQHPTVWLWPNIDAGSDRISRVLRRYRKEQGDSWLALVKNFDPSTFQKALKSAAVAVGNSSSFIRDSTFTGTPVVLVGDRQIGREHGENLISVSCERERIRAAVQKQLNHGPYEPSTLYGNGTASKQIVEMLERIPLYSQKRLHYIFE